MASAVRWAGWLMLLACGAACSRQGDKPYVPDSASARSALAIALDAWAAGETATQLNGQSPAVQVADSLRSKRQRLTGYQIVGELPIDGGRRFEVALQLTDPEEKEPAISVEKAQYVVLGIDPIWVIRQEDFDMITHWDHPMTKDDSAGAPAPPAETNRPPAGETP